MTMHLFKDMITTDSPTIGHSNTLTWHWSLPTVLSEFLHGHANLAFESELLYTNEAMGV